VTLVRSIGVLSGYVPLGQIRPHDAYRPDDSYCKHIADTLSGYTLSWKLRVG
jgi:hypothetical protein